MGKIPTAEEMANGMLGADCYPTDTTYCMVEFAKLHVEAALREALESIPCLGSSTDIASYEEVQDAVLNAYPLENIK